MKSPLTGISLTFLVNSEYLYDFSYFSLLLVGKAVFISYRRAHLLDTGEYSSIGSAEEVVLNEVLRTE
jgi:hypothetical protein